MKFSKRRLRSVEFRERQSTAKQAVCNSAPERSDRFNARFFHSRGRFDGPEIHLKSNKGGSNRPETLFEVAQGRSNPPKIQSQAFPWGVEPPLDQF